MGQERDKPEEIVAKLRQVDVLIRLRLTDDGRALPAAALPVWRAEQDRVDDALPAPEVALDLDLLTGGIRQMGSLDRTAGDAEAPAS